MQTSNLRNQLHIHWAQTFLVALLFLGGLANNSYGQKSKSINMPDYESNKLHYGFQIGLFDSGMKLKYLDGTTGYTTINLRRPSFSLGFITNFRLKDDLWALRILPNVSFYERSFQIRTASDTTDFAYESTVVEFPILLKLKSRRRNNHRMYMIGGITGTWELSNVKEDGTEFRKYNVEISYGAGFDLYWSFFKFSPELRFSHGLFNTLTTPGSLTQVDALSTHKVSLYLNFE